MLLNKLEDKYIRNTKLQTWEAHLKSINHNNVKKNEGVCELFTNSFFMEQ